MHQRIKWKRTAVATVVLLWLGASSCYYDVESDLYPNAIPCDTTQVSFSGTINPILEAKCNQCHNASQSDGGVTLEGYSEVIQWVDNGLLLCSVRWDDGCSQMPKNAPQIPSCDIAKIERWILDGAPEN